VHTSPLHVCNGLAHPANESTLARDIGTTGQTRAHSENTIAAVVLNRRGIKHVTVYTDTGVSKLNRCSYCDVGNLFLNLQFLSTVL